MERIDITDVIEILVLNKSLGGNNMFRWKVGNTYKPGGIECICSRIVHDTTAYFFNGQSRWLVYLENEGDEFLYAAYENASIEAKVDVHAKIKKK